MSLMRRKKSGKLGMVQIHNCDCTLIYLHLEVSELRNLVIMIVDTVFAF